MSSSDGDIDSEVTDESDFQAKGPIRNFFGQNKENMERVEQQPRAESPPLRRKSSRYRAPPSVGSPAPSPVPAPKSAKFDFAAVAKENILPMKKRSRSTPESMDSRLPPEKRARSNKEIPIITIDDTPTDGSSPAAKIPDRMPATTGTAKRKRGGLADATNTTKEPVAAKRKRVKSVAAPETTKEPLAVKRSSASANSRSASSRSATHSRTNSAADIKGSGMRSQTKPSTAAEPKDPSLHKPSKTTSTANQKANRNGAPPKRPSWADQKSEDFDVIRFLQTDEYLSPDPLAQLPQLDHTYIDSQGRIKDPHKYVTAPAPRPKTKPEHPKIIAHRKNGTLTTMNYGYYKDMPKHRVLPIAGIIRDKPDPRDEISYPRDYAVQSTPYDSSSAAFVLPNLSNYQVNILTIEEYEQEDNFYARPSIKLIIPDHIKAILVDDWENVTKNQQLVPIPAEYTVERILDEYVQFEAPRRVKGSAQADILEEVVAGLKEYFEKCLGRILLYRFERTQYIEAREGWAEKSGDLAGKNAVTTYGAEHFCRLLVSLPELIAQTNMDQQSVARLREELSKLTNWLGKEVNMPKYFVSEYETPSQAYVEKARNF